MEFKENLKKLRKEKGISQEQLGEIVGVSRSAIAGYEQGWVNPSQKVLIKLSELFNVSIDFIMGQIPNEIEDTIKTKDADIYNCFLAIIDSLNSNTMKYRDNKLNEEQREYIKKSLNHILDCIKLF